MSGLTSRIGRPVRFGAPLDVHNKGGPPSEGVIIDEVWVDPDHNESAAHSQPCDNGVNCWGDYSFCSQLIKWSNGNPHTHSIRLAYYRRRCGEDWWEFASQTTVVSDPQTVKTLCERTLAKETWFQDEPSATPPQSK